MKCLRDDGQSWAPPSFKEGERGSFRFGDILQKQDGKVRAFSSGLEYHILCVVSGQAEAQWPDKTCLLEKKCLLFCRTEELPALLVKEPSLRFFALGFDGAFLESLGKDGQPLADVLQSRWHVCCDYCGVRQIFIPVFHELSSDGVMREVLVRAYVNQILSLTCRNFFQEYGELSVRRKNRSPATIVEDIVRYVDQHAPSIQSMTEISDHFGYSYPYISGLFSSIKGIALKDYVCSCKLRQAKQHLLDGNSVQRTAQLVGYDSIHTFSRLFKRENGISPSEYRLKVQNDKERIE